MGKVCSNCKYTNCDASHYCVKCGDPLEKIQNSATKPDKKYVVVAEDKMLSLADDAAEISTLKAQVTSLRDECSSLESENSKKMWWVVVSSILLAGLFILLYALYVAHEEIDVLRWQQNDVDSRMTTELEEKVRQISTLQKQLKSNNTTINNLQKQLPQTYYTKYSNQKIYYWNGSYVETGSYWEEPGICVIIYLQKDGYGLTEYGWVPMDCLHE